jgi:large subunit ribosomal protein L13
MTKTYSLKKSGIKRKWHLVDLEDQVLGRIATRIAGFLIGKDKPYFAYHLDCGDFVVALNAKKIKVTGRKKKQKKYYRHSGYPGGFRETVFSKVLEEDPAKIIKHAVAGMIPKNKLRKKRMARLKVFANKTHPYQDKFKKIKK